MLQGIQDTGKVLETMAGVLYFLHIYLPVIVDTPDDGIDLVAVDIHKCIGGTKVFVK